MRLILASLTFAAMVLAQPVVTCPSAPADGDIWYNSTTIHIRIRDAGVTGGIAMTGGDGDPLKYEQ